MRMNEFLTALQTHLEIQQSINQNLLDLLYDAYNDTTGMDNVAIKAHIEDGNGHAGRWIMFKECLAQ